MIEAREYHHRGLQPATMRNCTKCGWQIYLWLPILNQLGQHDYYCSERIAYELDED